MDDTHASDPNLPRLADGCTLDRGELEERLGEIERLTRWALRERHDEDGGTVLTFDRAAASQVRDLVRRERDCCGHLDFGVEETDEAVRLAIRSRCDQTNHSIESAPPEKQAATLTTRGKGRAGMKLRILPGLAMAVLVAGCFGGPAPPPSAPAFPGYPGISQYTGSQCKTVLLVGDSLMTPVSNVGDVLQQSGRCAKVINAAVNGSAPTGTLQGVDWASRLQQLIQQYHPDIVVFEFVGNGFGTGDDAAWLTQLQAGIQNLVNIAKFSGVPYVAIAPMAAAVRTNQVAQNQFLTWQQTAGIAGAKKIDLNPYLAPGNQYSAYLDFGANGGIQQVRIDVIHLTDLGANIAGFVIAAAIAPEWT